MNKFLTGDSVQEMSKILLTVAMLTAATSLSAQDKPNPKDLGLAPDAIRSIHVRIADSASGACWTNLKEVRDYAEEKLRAKNYNLIDKVQSPKVPDFTFWIGVVAQRDSMDTCDGAINVSVQTLARVDRFFGRFVLTPEVSKTVSGAGRNFNRRVIEAVQEMTDHM
ncbi:hypothetical protein [uncultured Roseovarius sp.]|uniref:hypothetical protein n=1 Tax=uncultured Roseovarius sp. TaxID=293344 RepID=UPI002598A31E|nr:hypothetical protein [uncultured Roseovarius sp.]